MRTEVVTDNELETLIERQVWRFARTMPQWPHWYCLRKDSPDPEGFLRLARHICEAGYPAEFQPEAREHWAVRRYLDVGDFHYWIMDPDAESATLINRAAHPNAALRL
jgi:hypothetical protein